MMFDYRGQLELLVDSYGLTKLLEMNDITENVVLEMLVERGDIDLSDYFYNDMPIDVLEEDEEYD
jgi:phage head maturation protease